MPDRSSGDAMPLQPKNNCSNKSQNVEEDPPIPKTPIIPDRVNCLQPESKQIVSPPAQQIQTAPHSKDKQIQTISKHLKSNNQLKSGTILKDKWRIVEKVGNGGFGSIYEAHSIENGEKVAIKTEDHGEKWPFLRMELDVLRSLQGKSNVALFKACGRHHNCNYIVMQLLGKNIQQIRKALPEERFTMPTAFLICQQMIVGIKSLHESGYIHRDLKPANFAIPTSNSDKTIYILDFGLCRTHLNESGSVKPPRQACGFRGTVRYASINIHEGKDMGRHDDMWSLFYILVEMLTGRLPWRHLSEKQEVLKLKKKTDLTEIVKSGPPQLTSIHELIRHYDYYTTPQYSQIQNLLEEMLNERKINKSTYQYDWVRQSKRSSFQLSFPRKLKSTKRAQQIGLNRLAYPQDYNERAMSAIESKKYQSQKFPSTIAQLEGGKR